MNENELATLKAQTLKSGINFVNEGIRRAYNQNRNYLQEAINIATGKINMLPEKQHLRELYKYYHDALHGKKEGDYEKLANQIL